MSQDVPGRASGATGICAAFSDAWNEPSPVWTRLDDPSVPSLSDPAAIGDPAHSVFSWQTDRGRAYELDKTQTGTGTVKMYDTSGLFIPGGASPYAAGIGPMRRFTINVLNPFTKAYSDVFGGFIESWDWSITTEKNLMTATIGLVDGFEPFTRAEVVPGASGTYDLPGQLVDDRIRTLYADAGLAWPDLLTNINSGNVWVQGHQYQPETSMLACMQDAADAEFPGVANLYMDRHGNLAFRGRLPRFTPTAYPNQVKFWSCGDAEAADTFGYAPISDITWNLDQKNLINACLCYPAGLQPTLIPAQLSLASDFGSSSIADFGPRVKSLTDLLVLSGIPDTIPATTVCKQYADYYVQNYDNFVQRISSLVFKTVDPNGGTPNAALWNMLCNIEIGDVISVYTTWPGGGGFNPNGPGFPNQFFVEGIHNVVNPLNAGYPDWTMSLDVSPRAWFASFPS